MSHWTKVQLQIKSIPALKQACKELGLQFTDEKQAVGFGSLRTAVDYNIKIPNTRYTVGFKKTEDGYAMVADFYDATLRNAIGNNGDKLKQTYAVCAAEMEARKKGWMVTRNRLSNGKVKLSVRVR